MVTFAQAQERAEQWVNEDVPTYQRREVRVREFDLGFVCWAVDREDGPTSDGGRMRLVIARDSGEATLWPSLPVGEVVRRYEEQYGTAPASPPAPEPPRRTDLEATSFLLSPPQWLQDAADAAGIPDRRKSSSDQEPAASPAPGPGTTPPAAASPEPPPTGQPLGAAPAASPGAGAAVHPRGRHAAGRPQPPPTPRPPPAWNMAAPDGPSNTDGGAAGPPGAGTAPTPWAGTDTTDTGHGDSVAPPPTVFAPPLTADSDDDAPTGPTTSSEARTELLPAGSMDPNSAFAKAGRAALGLPSPEDQAAPGAGDPTPRQAPQPEPGPPGEGPPSPPEPGSDSLARTLLVPPVDGSLGGAHPAAPQPRTAGPGRTSRPAAAPAAGAPSHSRSRSRGAGADCGSTEEERREDQPAAHAGRVGSRSRTRVRLRSPRRRAGRAPVARSRTAQRPAGPNRAPAHHHPRRAGSHRGWAARRADVARPAARARGPVPPRAARRVPTALRPPVSAGPPRRPHRARRPDIASASTQRPSPGRFGHPASPGRLRRRPRGQRSRAQPGCAPPRSRRAGRCRFRPGPGQPPPAPGRRSHRPGPAPGAVRTPRRRPGQPRPAARRIAPPGMAQPPGVAGPPPPGPHTPPPPVPPAPFPVQPGVPTVGPGYMAVLRYRAPDGSEQQIIRRSAPGTPHPEWQILYELRNLNVPPQQVLELHTELESCDLPGGYCSRMIRESWPSVRISHTAPYGRDHASRQQGVNHLIEHQGELHQVAGGPARPRPQRVPLPHPSQVQRIPLIPPDGIGQELAQAFGPQGVFRFDQRAVSRGGVPDAVAQTLVWAGLPRDFGPFFWAQALPGRPVPTLAELAVERGRQPGPDAASYLVMGNDYGRQLCVQYGSAAIVAVPLEADPSGQPAVPQFVNTGLPEFVRCLALLGRMWRLRLGLTPDQAGRWTVDFQAHLAGLDPAALASPDNWWSVLLEQMWDGLL
ncbi:SUKH-4 family immunity protein [Wenjunlia vitaminophila]|uniref:SUKH-4 family immunity protein n=2 Tax=Wenjunlia vitaminophila TaxID=76728 RepID=UPI000AB8877C|nr:SUKH-4 family immunity protein [Wenjunlia vitaminophila]